MTTPFGPTVIGRVLGIDDGRRQPEVGEGLAPFAEGRVRGDGHGRALLALGQDLEQQLGPTRVEMDIVELVEKQQVESAVPRDDPGQGPLVGGFGQLVDEARRRDVADPPTPLAGGQPETDQEVRLDGAAVAQEDDRLTRGSRPASIPGSPTVTSSRTGPACRRHARNSWRASLGTRVRSSVAGRPCWPPRSRRFAPATDWSRPAGHDIAPIG